MAEENADASFIPALFKPPSLLPIARYRRELIYTIEKHPVTVVIGQTGSGKTTQLPQFLLEAGFANDGKVIAVTQPRRIAATSVAARVAQERQCELGQEVGYSIRFEDLSSEKTRIKFLTDGLLLREALVDPLLSRYSVIIVDEAHERSLSSDILLGMLKKIRQKREDLKIVISSATLQAEAFLNFFMAGEARNGEADQSHESILSLPGRMYPVDVEFLEAPTEDYLERAIQTLFDIHLKEDDGDVLIFLTGRDEIDKGLQSIAGRALNLPPSAQRITALSLYAGLPQDEQMEVFEPIVNGNRKVILATNIAEASVTVDGIVYVIDCGFVKLRAYNPGTSIETLTATPISKASATQRAGRAGRTKPGKCFRLYTEDDYNNLPESTVPEVQRSDLAPTILQLKALGIDNIARFDFFTSPPAELILRALELLYSLGALDDYAKLTRPLGMRMAELAAEPMMGKVLLSASTFGCLSEILSIVAMTSLQGSVWFAHEGEKKAQQSARHRFAAEEGDHLTLLNVYQAFVTTGKKEAQWCKKNHLNYKNMMQAVSIRNQLKRYLERFGIDVNESLSSGATKAGGPSTAEQIRRCLTTGLFAHAAKMQADGTFKTVNGEATLHAHPSSLMFNRRAEWVIFQQVTETSAKTFIRDITKIDRDWLIEYAPEFYSIR